MNKEQYKSAKKELKEKKWKLKHLAGSDSFSQHMKMHIDLLEKVINKYEDCHHINKQTIKCLSFECEVLK